MGHVVLLPSCPPLTLTYRYDKTGQVRREAAFLGVGAGVPVSKPDGRDDFVGVMPAELESPMMNVHFIAALSLLLLSATGCSIAPGHATLPLACADTSMHTEDGAAVFRVRARDLMAQPLSCNGRLVVARGFLLVVPKEQTLGVLFDSKSEAEKFSRRGGVDQSDVLWVFLEHDRPKREGTFFDGLDVYVHGGFLHRVGRRSSFATIGSTRIEPVDPGQRRPSSAVLLQLRRSLTEVSHFSLPPPPMPKPRPPAPPPRSK